MVNARLTATAAFEAHLERYFSSSRLASVRKGEARDRHAERVRLQWLGNGTWLRSATPRMRGRRTSGAIARTAHGQLAAALRDARALRPLRRAAAGRLAGPEPATRSSRTATSCLIGNLRSTHPRADAPTCSPCAVATTARTLTALLPVVSAWRAFRLPLPVLVSADPYGDLATPLIDGRAPVDAARALLTQARASGAHAIVLRHVTIEGAAIKGDRNRACRKRTLRPTCCAPNSAPVSTPRPMPNSCCATRLDPRS